MKHTECLIDIGPFGDEGAQYLRAQRAWLSKQPRCDESEGLMNFLDVIADQLHDRHGLDTLFVESENYGGFFNDSPERQALRYKLRIIDTFAKFWEPKPLLPPHVPTDAEVVNLALIKVLRETKDLLRVDYERDMALGETNSPHVCAYKSVLLALNHAKK